MWTVRLKLGAGKRPRELDLAIWGLAASSAIGTRQRNNREICAQGDEPEEMAPSSANGERMAPRPLGSHQPIEPHARGRTWLPRSGNGEPARRANNGGRTPLAQPGTAQPDQENQARNREWRIQARAEGGGRRFPCRPAGGGGKLCLGVPLAPGAEAAGETKAG